MSARARAAARTAWSAVLLLVLPFAVRGDADPPAPQKLLLPGTFHGDEISTRTGDAWLALVAREDGRDALWPVRLRVETVFDALVDDEGDSTGREVTVTDAPGEVAFLIRDIPGVHARSVRTIARRLGVGPGQPARLKLPGGATWKLSLSCAKPAGDSAATACTLSVTVGKRSQVLRTYEARYANGVFAGVGDDAWPAVLWAGDLNGDRALDLIVDLTDHYNVSRPTLYLGSAKRDGPLLEQVAEFRSVGC